MVSETKVYGIIRRLSEIISKATYLIEIRERNPLGMHRRPQEFLINEVSKMFEQYVALNCNIYKIAFNLLCLDFVTFKISTPNKKWAHLPYKMSHLIELMNDASPTNAKSLWIGAYQIRKKSLFCILKMSIKWLETFYILSFKLERKNGDDCWVLVMQNGQ